MTLFQKIDDIEANLKKVYFYADFEQVKVTYTDLNKATLGIQIKCLGPSNIS